MASLYDVLPQNVEVVWFTWRQALLGRWMVLHLHWPEHLFRGGDPLADIAKTLLSVLLLVRLYALRPPVVWTVHNLTPHEPLSRVERLLYRAVVGRVTFRVFLNAPHRSRALETLSESQIGLTTIIHHGVYNVAPRPAATPTHDFGSFGAIRAYKDTHSAVQQFTQHVPGDADYVVMGAPGDSRSVGALQAAAKLDPRVTLTLQHQEHAALEDAICSCRWVVLPHSAVGNSGIAMLALSLRRPVLARSTPALEELRDLAGPGWVHLTNGPIGELMARTRSADPPQGAPDLSAYSWTHIGEQYAQVFCSESERRRA